MIPCNFIKKKSIHTTVIIIVAVVLIFISLLLIYAKEHKKNQQPEAIFVNSAPVTQRNITIYAHAIGNVEPHATVSLKSLVDGQIIKVGFKEGDFVKTGQILFEVDPQPFIVKLQQAKANLAHDQAQLNAAETLLERNSKLVGPGYVSKQDFDQVKANHDSLAATIESDKAAIADAQLQLSYCTIASPIDGKTGNLLINVGNLVKANDQNPLVIINQIVPIDIKFSLTEKQLPQIQQQLKQGNVAVQAYLQQDNKNIKQGNLTFIDNTVDTQSGMIQLKASFANEDHYLWPGQFATVKLPIINLQNALLIPTRAIQVGEDKTYVFVIKNNVAAIKPIILGDTVDEQTVVRQGLNVGDIVVTEGQLRLTNGSKVEYKKNN